MVILMVFIERGGLMDSYGMNGILRIINRYLRKNGIKMGEESTKTESPIGFIKHKISKKNKWLYPTDNFGKLEKGVIDSSDNKTL
jgi:hypothetical protein